MHASRQSCAARLRAHASRISHLRAFVGLDGFVDVIAHVVDKRESAQSYQRLSTISQFAQRIASAAGHSTNIELVPQRTKLGGNGPIMANALAAFGLRVTYLGSLGYPQIHPVFNELAARAQVHSVADAGQTDAIEFSDGKIMLTSSASLNEVNWDTIENRYGTGRLLQDLRTNDLVAFVNWTMLPHLDELWSRCQAALGAADGRDRLLFVDLADPEKRTVEDLRQALYRVGQFGTSFNVTLGLNEKEAWQVAECLELPRCPGLMELAPLLRERLSVCEIVIHPVTYALVATPDQVARQEGPRIEHPVLTTGGGDHFNAGYCLGRLLKLSPQECLLLGVGTSGYYVGRGQTPALEDLIGFLSTWQ